MINLEKIKEKKSITELLEFGILNIDKPSGPTSFDVSDFVRRKLGAKKTSHAGTLDPLVGGVLPIMLNRACKLLGWFMKKDKTYVGVMKLHKDIEEEKLKEEIKKFIGKIIQLPPVKSRVKREEREREVYSWEILEFDKEKRNVLFKVECEAGTYVRKLISDLGDKIGGAHMAELRRTDAGIFSETDSNFTNLYELEKAIEEYKNGDEEKLRKMIIPGEIISEILPVIFVKKDNLKSLLTGKPIFKQDLEEDVKIENGKDACVFCKERFIGVYKKVQQGDIIFKAEFVLN
ncbi:RNA-guided pseudouridylation complex pseudouridine synthase subunit Cbf5 [Candidatus Pacearchaeota archaeon]|nr:RNA-guided pseudouridylation complex pseudouridine synthase subunit Cbf5 [Candidatus Pacearchaeota archaeon]